MCIGCDKPINHELLTVAKFKKDVENLLLYDWPLGGTLLGTDGKIHDSLEYTDFVHRLFKLEIRSQIVGLLDTNESPTMDDVKIIIEKAIQDKAVIKRVNKDSARAGRGSMQRSEGWGVRRMMRKYWDNSSIFALELGSAVIRQSSFVEKMQGIDWLHSPSALATMKRLLVKYERFIDMMAENPDTTLVPTLDVDLAWHTHRMVSSFDISILC
jgi:hypothetical protein